MTAVVPLTLGAATPQSAAYGDSAGYACSSEPVVRFGLAGDRIVEIVEEVKP